MGNTPNISGMVADPQFQGLSLTDKRAALGKVTGDATFGKLSDADTMQFLSKFSGPSKEQQTIGQLPNAAAQAKAQTLNPLNQLQEKQTAYSIFTPTGITRPAGDPELARVRGAQQTVAEGVGGAIGGEVAAPLAAGAEGVGGAITKYLLPKAIGSTGIGAGMGAGNLAATGSPQQALKTAAVGAGTGMALESTLSPFLKWLKTSKTAGAAALQQASAKAGSAPVELSAKTNELVDKIVQQGKLGGNTPKVISDLLERVGPTTKVAADAIPGPLTYDEARIIQSNASTLSAAEKMNLKGQLKSLIPQFAKSFSEDVQKAATAAGAGEEHAFGMQQYAAASARNRVLSKVGKGAAKVAGGGAAYELLRKANQR